MKVYISADIEGVTGTTHWDETQLSKGDYAPFREQMTAEVVAACEGALRALVALPRRFVLELAYRDHAKAYTFGFYPGARRVDNLTVQLETENYLDVLRALMFAM